MTNAISVKKLNKTYKGGHKALINANLEIEEGD